MREDVASVACRGSRLVGALASPNLMIRSGMGSEQPNVTPMSTARYQGSATKPHIVVSRSEWEKACR